MENWPDVKIEEPPVPKGEFEDLLSLYRDWKAKKSSNMLKFGLRVESVYSALPRVKRRQFCRLLMAEGQLDETLVKILDSSGGTLVKITLEEK